MTHQLKFECSSVKMQVIAGEGLRTIGHGSLNYFNALNAFYIFLMIYGCTNDFASCYLPLNIIFE